MVYLLDTNIVSELVRRPHGPVAERIREVGEEAVCTSLVVAGELRYGAAKKGSARLSAQLETVLGVLEVLPLESAVAEEYADIRHGLERTGVPIGPNDLWIAAQARALSLVLVTANQREFQRVPRLQVENWLDQTPR